MDAETEFYKSIPVGIRGKLQEYIDKYGNGYSLKYYKNLLQLYVWDDTPERHDFWFEYYKNNTFPIYSEEQQRFINP